MNLIQLNWFSRLAILSIAIIVTSFSAQAQGIYQNWGTTRDGGADGVGVIFSTDSAGGGLAGKHAFTITNKGGNPVGAMISYNSKLYGVAQAGGAGNKAIIFQYDPPPANSYSKIADITDATVNGQASDITEYNGVFYGTTYDGGTNSQGCIYSYNPATSTYTKLYDFFNTSGQNPVGALTLHNNLLYGVTYSGGTNDYGVIFQFDPATNTYSKLLDFAAGIGSTPTGSLTYYNGKLYGTTTQLASFGDGSVFEYDITTNTFTQERQLILASGQVADNGKLLLYNSKLYGLAAQGGLGLAGLLFEYNPVTNIYSSRYEFTGNGTLPQGGLVASGTKLIGLTYTDGTNNKGVLFEYDEAANAYTEPVSFNGTNGANSYSTLTAFGGTLYGTTKQGGSANMGVIFQYDAPTTTLTKEVDFATSPAANPSSSLTYYNKLLYGTTQKGGANGLGTIYQYNKATGATTILYSFDGTNGSYPMGDLVLQSDKFYAMTIGGGTNDNGVIFSFDPASSTYTKMHDFSTTITGGGGNVDIASANYNSNLLAYYNGLFYGVTHAGGANGSGAIFSIDPATSTYSHLYDFPTDLGDPTGGLTALNGKLYGLTIQGGADNQGSLFEFDPATNGITNKHEFSAPYMLASAAGELGPPSLTVSNGKLYGVAFYLGGANDGFLFSYDPSAGTFSTFDFDNTAGGSAAGSAPTSKLMERNGVLYGMTYSGGTTGDQAGVVYQYDPVANAYSANSSFTVATTGAGATGTALVSVPALVAAGTLGSCKSITAFTPSTSGWKGIVDADGSAVAEVNPNGNNLGTITPTYYVQSNPARTYNTYSFLNRSISISVATQPTSAVDVRFYVKKSEIDDLKASPNSSITSANDIIVFKSEATGCAGTIANDLVKLPTTVSTWEDDYVYTVSVTSFSTFHFASLNVTLPITLLDFTANRKAKGEVLLNWSTSTEINSNYFSIERGEDPAHFSAVGKLPAAGTSSIKKSYQYTDLYSSDNDVYYRLKMVDKDGTFKYSKTVKVSGAATTIAVSPNPAHNTLTITGARFTQLQIIDATGRLVSQFGQASSNQYDISKLQQGMYTLRFINGTTVTSSRFVKL